MANTSSLPGTTPITIPLSTLMWMIKRIPNTEGQLFMLNQSVSAPSRVEELYILGMLNTATNVCDTAPRYSYNQAKNLWEWY